MLGWVSSCDNLLSYLRLFPLASALDGESLNQKARWASLRFFEHSAKLLPWGLLSFGSTWWKMSLIAVDRQGQAREKEHSKHSIRKRHSRVTKGYSLGDVLSWYESIAGVCAIYRHSSLQGQQWPGHTGLFFVSWSPPSSFPPQGLCVWCVLLLGKLLFS